MAVNGESIHGSSASPLPPQSWGVITSKAKTLYLHVFDRSPDSVVVGGLESTPTHAWLLKSNGREPVQFKRLNARDLAVALPSSPADAADSVVVLEFDETPRGGGDRLLSSRTRTNQLLAFDAERHRKNLTGAETGLGYRDGKLKNYCVDKWNSTEQWLSWEVRLNEPIHFDLSLNYGLGLGGDYEVRCGTWTCARTAPSSGNANAWIADTKVESLGSLFLPAGTHRIELHVTRANAGDVFRPLELWLAPQ